MGSIGNRVTRLEERYRGQAVEDLRQAWDALADEEVALLLDPYTDVEVLPDGELRFAREPTPAQRRLSASMRDAAPEELIARAIGFTERMDSQEIDRRMKALLERIGLFERKASIQRHMRDEGEG